MPNALEKELELTIKQEQKLLNAREYPNALKAAVYQKVPQGLRKTLEGAFCKAFEVVFLKGTAVIEKTFDKESAELEYEAGNYIINKAKTQKSIRRLDQNAKRSNLRNNAATTVTGAGLGLLGLGLPDIPLLVSTLLRGVYEVATSYGFGYNSEQEQIYILRLIRTALCEKSGRAGANELMECASGGASNVKQEISDCARALSDALLVEKFVQGIPIIGVVGGFVNHAVYRKVARLAQVKYKKRYLEGKLIRK